MVSDREYLIWLCSVPALSRQNISVLLRYFGSPREIFEAPDAEYEAFRQLGLPWLGGLLTVRDLHHLHAYNEALEKCSADFIGKEDSMYPSMLAQIADPPYGLFYRGKLPEKDVYTAAIVGARQCSQYGVHMAEEIAGALASCGIQVVSGMAAGIDGLAQNAALQAGAATFGILGSGVDICYPREHISLFNALSHGTCGGGVISEFPCGSPGLAWHFPMRNRIISGISDAVIVVEARQKSGSLITASLALDQGRDVYAVPGRSGDVLSGGCNDLIATGGAGMVVSTEELCRTLLDDAGIKGRQLLHGDDDGAVSAGQKREKQINSLTAEQKQVYSLLDYTEADLDQLLVKSKLERGSLAVALLELEMKGLVKQRGKNWYVRA